jgi:hypothetical protein
LIQKNILNISAVFFSSFLAIKTLDLDPDSLEMLDPDDSMNSNSYASNHPPTAIRSG